MLKNMLVGLAIGATLFVLSPATPAQAANFHGGGHQGSRVSRGHGGNHFAGRGFRGGNHFAGRGFRGGRGYAVGFGGGWGYPHRVWHWRYDRWHHRIGGFWGC